MNPSSPAPASKHKSGWLNVLVDYGPLLVFLGVYKFYAPDDPGPLGEIVGSNSFLIDVHLLKRS